MSRLYKIVNYEYQHKVADLLDGVYTGPVAGLSIQPSDNQNWTIIAAGDNRITLKIESTGTYANPELEEGVWRIVGGTDKYEWQQITVPGGWYQIATTDGKFVWILTDIENRSPIVLRELPYDGYDAQWGYEPTR